MSGKILEEGFSSMRVRPFHAVAVLGVSLCTAVHADTYAWNFTGNGGAGSGANSYTFSNTVPAGGPSVTATAWYVNGSNLLQRATVGQYSVGLGICNPGESCISPHHQADNLGQLEFILFQFSQPLSNISFSVNPSPDSNTIYNGNTDGSGDDNVPDRDVSYFAGSPALGASLLTGLNFNTMSTLFNTASDDIPSAAGGGGITVNLGFSGSVNAVLFGALDSVNGGTFKDFFKIGGMGGTTTTTTHVPEPGSIFLLGTILSGVAYVIRKKRATV
jgi:hypothetical protein